MFENKSFSFVVSDINAWTGLTADTETTGQPQAELTKMGKTRMPTKRLAKTELLSWRRNLP